MTTLFLVKTWGYPWSGLWSPDTCETVWMVEIYKTEKSAKAGKVWQTLRMKQAGLVPMGGTVERFKTIRQQSKFNTPASMADIPAGIAKSAKKTDMTWERDMGGPYTVVTDLHVENGVDE